MSEKLNQDFDHNRKKKPQNQVKQIALMAGAVLVCAVMVTWTVMLMRERLGRNGTSEQSSSVDVLELPPDYTEETGTVTKVTALPWSEEDITTAPPKTTDPDATTTSTSATNATAASAVLSTQPAHFVRVGTTSRTQATAAPGTTHTEAQQPPQTTVHNQETQPQTPTPASPPAGAQIVYNHLLAMYLSAQSSSGSAYFADAFGNAQPAVILSSDSGLYAITPVGGVSKRHRLGGTGDENTHPTGQPFRLYQCDSDTTRALYYVSEGDNNKTVGYLNNATCNQIWATLHYTQAGAEWQAEYTITSTAPDGTSTQLSAGSAAASELYALPETFVQEFDRQLQTAGIQPGDTAAYPELLPNNANDSSTLWSKAGSYNSGFSLQGSGAYGVVCLTNDSANLRAGTSTASNIVAVVPPGAFLSVDRSRTVNGWVPVSALINGTWYSGYMSSELLMTWDGQ